jgi:hypothetical protein
MKPSYSLERRFFRGARLENAESGNLSEVSKRYDRTASPTLSRRFPNICHFSYNARECITVVRQCTP